MEQTFDVKTAQLGDDTFVVSVTGEADMETAPEIERELQDVLRRGGRSVAVDLVDVGFIDSSALGLLLRFQPRFKARGGDLVLVSDDRRVLRTLEITGLDRIFRIEQRLGDAVGGLYTASAAESA
ncbi:MAG TPA: STAS domain-containing protein [Gaiellaceae bacterium]